MVLYCAVWQLTCGGVDVPVADGGHGDHHPVEGGGDGGEAGVFINLNEVCKTCEDEAADTNEEDQKTQFFVTILKRVSYGLQT